MVDYK